MSAWSAWNVTGTLNSEILRILSQIQYDVYQMETNKVTKGGDNVTGNSSVPLVIGTNTDNPLQFETNNVPRMTIENTGNVSVAQQIEIAGTQSAPGLCSSVNNDTGMYFPADATVQMVGNDAVMAEVTPTEMTVSSARVDFGDNGPYIKHSGTKFTMDSLNHTLELTVQGQNGINIDKSGTTTTVTLNAPSNGQVLVNSNANDLRFRVQGSDALQCSTTQVVSSKETLMPKAVLSTRGTVSAPAVTFSDNTDTGIFLRGDGQLALSADGVEALRCSAYNVVSSQEVMVPKTMLTSRGTKNEPAVRFSDNTDTGIYLNNDGLLTICQDGSDVFKCYNSGVDMVTDSLFFNTVTDPQFPQICWDSSGARDTGFYSPQDGIIRARNNALETLNLSNYVLSHMQAHNGHNASIPKEFPMFGSWIGQHSGTLREYDLGDPERQFPITMSIMHTRVGNIVTSRGMISWFVNAQTDGIGLAMGLHYYKHGTSSTTLYVGGKSYSIYNYCGTIKVLNNEPPTTTNNVVAEGFLDMISVGTYIGFIGTAWHKIGLGTTQFPINKTYQIMIDVMYEINLS